VFNRLDYVASFSHSLYNQDMDTHTNKQRKTTKKPKAKSNAQVRDLKPKKDAKGGDGYIEIKSWNH